MKLIYIFTKNPWNPFDSGGVLQAALNNALRGAVTRITRPMVNASPTGAGGQTAVLRPQQLPPGQQRIGK